MALLVPDISQLRFAPLSIWALKLSKIWAQGWYLDGNLLESSLCCLGELLINATLNTMDSEESNSLLVVVQVHCQCPSSVALLQEVQLISVEDKKYSELWVAFWFIPSTCTYFDVSHRLTFPTSICQCWDSNPHQQSCADLGPFETSWTDTPESTYVKSFSMLSFWH